MPRCTFVHKSVPFCLLWLSVGLAGATATSGWSATGTVKSSAGVALSGVSVTVQDSAGISATTDAAGSFSIGSTTGIIAGSEQVSGWALQVVGRDLEVRSPVDGALEISLLDGAGRNFWGVSAVSSGGVAHATLPSGLRMGVAFLRVGGAQGEIVRAVTTGPEGVRIASHIATPRSLSIFPVLRFARSGYKDTSYSMTAASATGISITMRDTATATCPSTKLSAGDQTKTLSINGVSRTYILHVPSAYKGTSTVPLVVDFHPIGGSASGEESASPYKAYADADGAITAYPNGLQSPNAGQAWDVGPCCTTADDTDFARAIVKDVEKVACINSKRVYAVGYSMGGGMTHYTACHIADVFAAAAPAAFDLLTANEDACKPSRPITMVMFRSTGDGTVAYAGAYSSYVTGMSITFLGAVATFQKWASIDQCTGSPSTADANGCSTYSNCGGGVQVTLCTTQGGGHDYGKASIGWPILKEYTLP